VGGCPFRKQKQENILNGISECSRFIFRTRFLSNDALIPWIHY